MWACSRKAEDRKRRRRREEQEDDADREAELAELAAKLPGEHCRTSMGHDDVLAASQHQECSKTTWPA